MSKKVSRIVGGIMLAVAVVFVAVALGHPEMSFPWSNTVPTESRKRSTPSLPIMPDISAITPTFTGITTWIWRTTSRRN